MRNEDRPKARFARIVSEAVAGITQRPVRSVLTALGTVLGIGTFVAILGITSTANGQVEQQFNALTSTQLTVQPVASSDGRAGFPDDAEDGARRILGVQQAAISWDVAAGNVRSLPPGLVDGEDESIRVVAVTPSYWNISKPRLASGRVFDVFTGTQPVAVVGKQIAEKLGIVDVSHSPAIFIGGRAYSVIGIVDTSHRVTEPETSIIIPAAVALRNYEDPRASATMTVTTDLGAAEVVAKQLPVAIDPRNPEGYSAVPPASSEALKTSVSAALQSLFLALAAICLLIGAVSIANSSLIAVMERTPEIGLRRALGAMPRHVVAQFLTESTILGAFGGMIGGCLGVVLVVVVSALNQWTPTISPWTISAAPVVGAGVGLLAGLYPSLRAARIDPIEAFRR